MASEDSLHEAIRTAWRGLDDETIQGIRPHLREQVLEPGQVLFRQGDDVDGLFMVTHGKLAIVLEETGNLVLEEIGPRGIVGEIAILIGGKRTATARAAEPTRVLGIDRDRLESLFRDHPALSDAVARAAHHRLRRNMIAKRIGGLFGAIDRDALRELEERVTWVQLRSGDELFHQGDPADGAYIVALGRLRVAVSAAAGAERTTAGAERTTAGAERTTAGAERTTAGAERTIDELGPGEWVGEMALLTRKPRSATVYAVRDTELLWLSQQVFDELMLRHPAALLETSRALVLRLQRRMAAASTLRQFSGRCFAILPVRGDLDLAPFVAELTRSLSRYGKVCHLCAAGVDARLEKPGISQVRQQDTAHMRLASWLLGQEESHDFVLYEADPTWTEWTDRALRHADEILLVGSGPAPAGRSEVEQRLVAHVGTGRTPYQRLVLLQPSGRSSFPGTSAWLAHRTVDVLHHVRRGVRGDHDRLARLMTGNAISLVLGGGGSRGYAHLGVVRALAELRVPIDAVGGTSIGAMVASGVGMELTAAEMLKLMPPLLRAAFMDPTLPFVALMSGNNVLKGARAITGDLDLEDLAVPTTIVATNLTRGEPCVLRRGSVAMGIRASSSIPGIFPPVSWNGDFLIDGGLSNNVPVDVMASAFGGKIIAVDVIPEVELRDEGANGASVSGWGAAWRRINPFHRHAVPNMLTVLMRTVTTGSRGLRNSADCALLLRPSVSRWNMIDFGAAEPIAEEGYRGTVDAIRAWWSSQTATT